MSGNNSNYPMVNLNLGDLAQPVSLLIEKCSDAIKALYQPTHLKKIAQAEIEIEKMKLLGQIENREITNRAINRWLVEETRRQKNIESIFTKALPHVKEDADPNGMEDDWIANFFDKCRLISDEQMQVIWASLLAEEANSPGSCSKRTVNLLASISKGDALLFTSLCGFAWFMNGTFIPLVYDYGNSIYKAKELDFESLEHLDDIGLINFDAPNGYGIGGFSNKVIWVYYDSILVIDFPDNNPDRVIALGTVRPTKIGQELARICKPEPVSGFIDYVVDCWMKRDLIVSSPYPQQISFQ